jgi:PPOX class probable F420-dependent enzyme
VGAVVRSLFGLFYGNGMTEDWVARVRSLLQAPSPAVLTTYRKDGSALVSPVWFRWSDGAFEIVIAAGDLKLRHLERDPRCALVVFEALRPFRGVEVRGIAELVECDVTSVRAAIAGRYLGVRDGRRFAAERRSKPGVLLRLAADTPRVWDLSGILPT